MMRSKTLSLSVDCPSRKAAEFVLDPKNLPKWAKTFCRSIKNSGDEWIIETPQGTMRARFAAPNAFGVLDHYILPAPGVEIYVPFRAVPNDGGSELLFTLFQQPGMSDEAFAADESLVLKDLFCLKELLETS